MFLTHRAYYLYYVNHIFQKKQKLELPSNTETNWVNVSLCLKKRIHLNKNIFTFLFF